jgi:hypothetical protein
MAPANNSATTPRITGGQAGIRGYLVQTLIALLDSLLTDPPFDRVTIEPDHVSEKIDILWEAPNARRAVQVKSSANQFAESDVRRWAHELEAARSASEYRLCLVGLHSSGVAAMNREGKVAIDKKNLDLLAFREQAAHRLDRFLRDEGLDAGTPDDREMLADALTARLATYSTTGQPMMRADLIRLLRRWVAEAPKAGLQTAPSRLRHGADQLFGRDKELAQLDAALADPAIHVLSIVAWGGVGKTSLVVEWMNRLSAKGWPGIARVFDWSFYSQGTRDQGIVSSDNFIAVALKFFGDEEMSNSGASPWDKGSRLAELVVRRPTILVLDGIESMQYPPGPLSGKLKDPAIECLLKGLSRQSLGLCIATTRESLSDLGPYRTTVAPELKLDHLSEEAGAALLTSLGVEGTDDEKRELTTTVKGHALTLALLGRYLKRAHHGDIRRVDCVDFQEVNDREQGAHAFRVMAAYERWFEENGCRAELAILRVLGLFDGPAAPDCLAALSNPPISGLTDDLARYEEPGRNEALSNLSELALVEERPWEPRKLSGHNEERAEAAIMAADIWARHELGPPDQFGARFASHANDCVVDTHPLVREYFAKSLQELNPNAWTTAHSRLFDFLQVSAPHWPEGLESLQPLYQAVSHGCQASRTPEALRVFIHRINRGTSGLYPNPHASYATAKLGAFSTDLSALAWFFDHPWSQPSAALTPNQRGWVVAHAALNLQAIGRLVESLQLRRLGLQAEIDDEDWTNAARSAGGLSQLQLALGLIAESIHTSEQSVKFSDLHRAEFVRIGNRAHMAAALHQAGDSRARKFFVEAEAMQAISPVNPLLNGVFGFHYCDFLLAAVERGAWKAFAKADDTKAAPETGEDTAPHILKCAEIERRATETLRWASEDRYLLNIALDHLTLGRAALYRDILEKSKVEDAKRELEQAVEGLRIAGTMDHLPHGLTSRAWLRLLEGDPDGARGDLDQAWEIAERGPMRLHMADIHLHRARLFKDNEELKKARAMIEQCGYWRRKEELEDAEEAAKNW